MPQSGCPPTRVLFVFEYGTLNGGERSLLAVLPQLVLHGVQPILLAPATGELACTIQQENWPFVPLPWSAEQDLSQTARRERIASSLQSCRPDLVHANSLSMGRLVGPVARELRIPSVTHLRDMMRISRQAARDLGELDARIAVSHATANWYREARPEMGRVDVVHNGIEVPPVASNVGLSSTPRGPDSTPLRLPPHLLSVGQLGLRKGHDVLLAAFEQVLSQEPRATLRIIGERNSSKLESIKFETAIRQRAGSPPLAGHVELLGRQPDVFPWMRQATLLVHTARQEPLGRVLLEAAATGLPVVATDVGGTREIFPQARDAKLVPPHDPRAVADAIAEILAAPDAGRDMACRAREYVRQFFSLEDCGKRLFAIYRQMIDLSD